MACRKDNGLCLIRLAKKIGDVEAWVQFTDGSIYIISPVTDAEVYALPTRAQQPGCWFNGKQHHDPRYRYRKVSTFPRDIGFGWVTILW